MQPFFGALSGALIMSALIPPVYLALMLFCLCWLSEKMIAPKWGNIAASLFLIYPFSSIGDFKPGHIDHHGLVALLAIAAFCCIKRMLERPATVMWAAGAGVILALGLTLALDIVVVIGVLCICLGLWAIIEGGSALRSGLVFSGSLFIASFVLLLATHPFQQILEIDIRFYSIVYIVLTGCIALCFTSIAFMDKKSALARCLVGGGFALATACIFLHSFPQLKAGPYGAVDPVLAKMIFSTASEAWPVIGNGNSLMGDVSLLIWPMLAIAANLFMIVRAPSRDQRWSWTILFCTMSTCVGLAAFYQNRFFSYAQPLSTIPLAGIIWAAWTHQSRTPQLYRAVCYSGILLFFLIGFISTMTLDQYHAAAYNDEAVSIQIVKGSSSNTALSQECDIHGLADLLNDKTSYGAKPRLIINSLALGPDILFRTPHMVLAGPFHTNTEGNLDVLEFFSAADPGAAKAIAQRRNADLVIFCDEPSQLDFYTVDQSDKMAKGDLFIEQLASNHIPDWLQPVTSPKLGDIKLFEVHLPQN